MRLAPDVIEILDESTLIGNRLLLPGRQLDRALYGRVDAALKAIGGKWNRAAKAHLFEGNPADALDNLITTGEVTTHQDIGYFPTPPPVVDRLLDLADLGDRSRARKLHVLEPSAGRGAIAQAVRARGCMVDCVENDPANVAAIKAAGFAVWVGDMDFLTLQPAPIYDRVIMNPPFARQQDIDHVRHAYLFVRHGGLLVAVMSIGVRQRVNRKAAEFRAFVEMADGWFEDLPDDAFRPSGTGVRTCIAYIPS